MLDEAQTHIKYEKRKSGPSKVCYEPTEKGQCLIHVLYRTLWMVTFNGYSIRTSSNIYHHELSYAETTTLALGS